MLRIPRRMPEMPAVPVMPATLVIAAALFFAVGCTDGTQQETDAVHSPATAPATALDVSLIAAYADSVCTYCTQWNVPQEPFLLHGSTYYVGTRGLSAILVTSDDGHILIDAALPNSAPLILDNIRALGFEPADVALILNSHAHFDHAGGIAAVAAATGARVAATSWSAEALERGNTDEADPQYPEHLDFPAVADVERFTAGDTLRVGSLALASHATAGHTPGGTSWSWESCDNVGCVEIVYADSQTPVSADGFKYIDSSSYPNGIRDFESGLATLEALRCDILVSTHPEASGLWERHAARDSDRDGFVEAGACAAYAAAGRERLARRIAQEMGGDNQ